MTLLVAYVAAGRATLGWVQIDDDWKAGRDRAAARRGGVAGDALDPFYREGPVRRGVRRCSAIDPGAREARHSTSAG